MLEPVMKAALGVLVIARVACLSALKVERFEDERATVRSSSVENLVGIGPRWNQGVTGRSREDMQSCSEQYRSTLWTNMPADNQTIQIANNVRC